MIIQRTLVLFACLVVVAAAEAPNGMVWIPPGTFVMGSDQPNTNNSERPVHQVQVLVLVTTLGAAETDTPMPVTPPTIVSATMAPAATPTASTTMIPIKPACCCEASGGRAGLLARSLATTPTPVVSQTPAVSPTPVVPPSP